MMSRQALYDSRDGYVTTDGWKKQQCIPADIFNLQSLRTSDIMLGKKKETSLP